MRDLEYINNNLLGVSRDCYDGIIGSLQKHHLSPPPRGWLYSAPYRRSIGSGLEIFLQAHLPNWLSQSNSEKTNEPAYFTKRILPTMSVRFIASMILSLCSGASIIVPMVIMSFNGSTTKSLVTVSVAVVLFGFVLAAVVKVSSGNLIAATATYAAVLVVFVGVSGANSD